MAKIIKKNQTSTYKKYYYKGIAKIAAYILIAVIGIALIIYTKGISAVLLLSLLFIQPELRHFEIMRVGLRGEKITDDILLGLPGRYNILSDVIIYKEGGKNQLDHVVVGKNGIFIVETKYHSGIIKGKDKDVKALQIKQNASGQKFYNRFLNPSLQVETHIRAIKRVLEKHGYQNMDIIGTVFFSNVNAKVKLKSKKVKIFSIRKKGRVKLLRYIKWHHTSHRLSRSEIKAVIKILSNRQK